MFETCLFKVFLVLILEEEVVSRKDSTTHHVVKSRGATVGEQSLCRGHVLAAKAEF